MLFSDTVPGTPFTGESAARFNAVNSLLRSAGVPVAENSAPPTDFRLNFINTSSQNIPAFSPVAVNSVSPGTGKDWFDGQNVVSGIPAADESLPWGIALEDVAPGQMGIAAISGLIPAYFSGEGPFVTVSNGELISAAGGSARVLINCREDGCGNLLPGMLLSGGTAAIPAADEYNGIFELRALSRNTVRITNGREPDSACCGYTDVPGCETIPVTDLTLSEQGEVLLYICFIRDEEKNTYSWSFETDVPSGVLLFKLLGKFRGGSVSQIFESDYSRMIFGEEWYLQ